MIHLIFSQEANGRRTTCRAVALQPSAPRSCILLKPSPASPAGPPSGRDSRSWRSGLGLPKIDPWICLRDVWTFVYHHMIIIYCILCKVQCSVSLPLMKLLFGSGTKHGSDRFDYLECLKQEVQHQTSCTKPPSTIE